MSIWIWHIWNHCCNVYWWNIQPRPVQIEDIRGPESSSLQSASAKKVPLPYQCWKSTRRWDSHLAYEIYLQSSLPWWYQSHERHERSSRNSFRHNIRNGMLLYKRARVTGSVDVVWSLFEYGHVKLDPLVPSYKIHLENQPNIIIRNSSTLPKQPQWFISSWTLQENLQ